MSKDKWEKLTELPEEYEVNPDLAKNAMQIIQAKQAEKASKKGWWHIHWKKLTYALAACVVFVGVFIPVYQAYFAPEQPPQIIYYADETIETYKIDDVNTFVSENQLSVKYFSLPNTNTQKALLAENDTLGYLSQRTIYMDATGFDQVGLYAVVLQNAEFSFEKDYESMTANVVYNAISIQYERKTDVSSKALVLAKFSADNVKYYLEIQTAGEAEAKVLQYVAMLMQE